MNSLISIIIGVVMAVVALVILAYDLYMRRKIMNSELDLQQRKFKRDEEERNEWQHWLDQQLVELTKISKPLAQDISKALESDYSWAVEALERAKIGPYSETLFGDRLGHFRDEKDEIAQQFSRVLLSRCKYLCEELEKHVFLLIDSGTTLYPFFEYIGKQTVQSHESGEKWIELFTLVTNNLPGVQTLMQVGRPNPGNRYSELAVNCRLLPGVPLPIYSAVTGKATVTALENLKKQADEHDSAIFISLVTGNWIRIRTSDPRCPVPLARGKGHLPFKQSLIDISNEVYVISPLGKIFANCKEQDVNNLLRFRKNAGDPERKAYEEVKIFETASQVKLISTSRKHGRILQNLSLYLQGQLAIGKDIDEDLFAKAEIGKTQHILFPFDNLPDEEYLERTIEFPHSHTRREDFMKIFMYPGK